MSTLNSTLLLNVLFETWGVIFTFNSDFMGLFGKLFGGKNKEPANGRPADSGDEPLCKIGPGTGLDPSDPNEVRLDDDSKLSYHLLANESPTGVLMPAEVHRAKGLLTAILASEDPEVIAAVDSCRGKTREQARAILRNISGAENRGQAAA